MNDFDMLLKLAFENIHEYMERSLKTVTQHYWKYYLLPSFETKTIYLIKMNNNTCKCKWKSNPQREVKQDLHIGCFSVETTVLINKSWAIILLWRGLWRIKD